MLRNLKLSKVLPSLQVGIRTLFINPAADHIPTTTTADIVAQIGAIYGIPIDPTGSSEYRGRHGNKSEIRKKLTGKMGPSPKDQSELKPRRMKDSFVTAVIPLEKDSSLRERYITFYGGLRIGRLLEDLDVFAAWACHKHIMNPEGDGEGMEYPFVLVTALVDKVNFSGTFLKANADVRLAGHVSWVGRSSMEVAIVVDQMSKHGAWKKLTSAKFVFVARNPTQDGAVFVNPLVGETEEEKAFIQRGEARSKQRKMADQESLYLKPPSEEERSLIHKLFLSSMDPTYGGFSPVYPNPSSISRPPNTRLMEESRLNTLLLCHPQYRNMFDKIFGGLIMRKAFELAFSNTYLYTKSRPTILSIDDIKFKKSVEIGALLRFGSEVAYVEEDCVHTPVIEVLNPLTGESHVTNIFHFTFMSNSDSPPPTLLPKTYQEAIVYLNARRHFNLMKQEYLANIQKR